MASMTEIWKPIKGMEGEYEVSNLGRVRSLDRTTNRMSRWGHPVEYKTHGKIMTPSGNGNGYLGVYFRGDRKKTIHYVHRLVAEAFVDNPNGYTVVDHIDHNRGNNRADNLRWCTQLQNTRWSAHLMRYPIRKPKSNTGEPFIFQKKEKQKGHPAGYYLYIRSEGVYKRLDTLEEAVSRRKEVVGW